MTDISYSPYCHGLICLEKCFLAMLEGLLLLLLLSSSSSSTPTLSSQSELSLKYTFLLLHSPLLVFTYRVLGQQATPHGASWSPLNRQWALQVCRQWFFHAPGSLPPSRSAIQGEKVSCFSNMGLMEKEVRASGTRQCPHFTLFDENVVFWVSMRTLDGHWLTLW